MRAPETVLLDRIRARAAENLRALANYTCTENIDRSWREREFDKFKLVDKLRMEVALVDGRELFALLGAGKFEKSKIPQIGHAGAIGNGSFAMHAEFIFQTPWPSFTYVGETVLNGQRAVRYDYRVPLLLSNYAIKTDLWWTRIDPASGTERLEKYPPDQALVGYRGSIWVDANTLDLIRLEVHTDDIPRILKVTAASESIEYRRVSMRGADFLLPEFSELAMRGAGSETLNRTEFSACRPYTVESALRFNAPTPPPIVIEVAPVTKDAPPPAAADPQLLPRIKAKAVENLQRMPNYTCTQTIERSRRSGAAMPFDLSDRLRLEVALVDGRELFSWPGEGNFEEKGIGEIVGGTISNGNFALHQKEYFSDARDHFYVRGRGGSERPAHS